MNRQGAFKQVKIQTPEILGIGSDEQDFKIPSRWSKITPAPWVASNQCVPDGVNNCSVFQFTSLDYAPPNPNINNLGSCVEGDPGCFILQNKVPCLFSDQIQGQYGSRTCINPVDTQSGIDCISSVDGTPVKLGGTECVWSTCESPLANCKTQFMKFLIMNFDGSFIVPPAKNWTTNPLTNLKCITHNFSCVNQICNSDITASTCNIQNSGFDSTKCGADDCKNNIWIITNYQLDSKNNLVQSNSGTLCSIQDRSTGGFLAVVGFNIGEEPKYESLYNKKLTLIQDASANPGVWWTFIPALDKMPCQETGFQICNSPPQLVFTGGWEFTIGVNSSNLRSWLVQITDQQGAANLDGKPSIQFSPTANKDSDTSFSYPPCPGPPCDSPPCSPTKSYFECDLPEWQLTVNSFLINAPGYPVSDTDGYTWDGGFKSDKPVSSLFTSMLDYSSYTDTVITSSFFNS